MSLFKKHKKEHPDHPKTTQVDAPELSPESAEGNPSLAGINPSVTESNPSLLDIQPDMQEEVITVTDKEVTPEGAEVVQDEIVVPEKGILRTENLVKRYGKRTVADHVSINVRQGEIVGLLGPNGAGKTTTFYMTVGLIHPNGGSVYLDEENITSFPMYKRAQIGISYLPQEASVFRTMTVEDNIKSILQMTNTSKEYQKEKLETLLNEFKLQHVRHNKGANLSGGERRRTEIARCLAINPKFIMLDEPFAAVDPIAVEDIQEVVYHLKERNIGILITDHKADSILGITDRAYLLFEGKVLFQGTSEELVDNPIVREKYLGQSFVFTRKEFN